MKNLKHLTKRSLALFLVLVMCLGMMQVTAFADEPDTTSEPDSITQNEEPAEDFGQEPTGEEKSLSNDDEDEILNNGEDEILNDDEDEILNDGEDEILNDDEDEILNNDEDEILNNDEETTNQVTTNQVTTNQVTTNQVTTNQVANSQVASAAETPAPIADEPQESVLTSISLEYVGSTVKGKPVESVKKGDRVQMIYKLTVKGTPGAKYMASGDYGMPGPNGEQGTYSGPDMYQNYTIGDSGEAVGYCWAGAVTVTDNHLTDGEVKTTCKITVRPGILSTTKIESGANYLQATVTGEIQAGDKPIETKPAPVCTCTEMCNDTANNDCPVCKADRTKCTGEVIMAQADLYFHFVPTDDTQAGPEVEDIPKNFYVTYSYTFNGQAYSGTLNSADAYQFEQDIDDPNYQLHQTDPVVHWVLPVPHKPGGVGTTVYFQLHNYTIPGFTYGKTYSTDQAENSDGKGAIRISSGDKDHPNLNPRNHFYNRYSVGGDESTKPVNATPDGWVLDISQKISNYQNTGDEVNPDNFPASFAIDVTVSYFNGTQRVSETKTLTKAGISQDIKKLSAGDGKLVWNMYWADVFKLPDWQYDFVGTGKNASDFAATYNTIITISEKNWSIDGYTCGVSAYRLETGDTFSAQNATQTITIPVRQSGNPVLVNQRQYGFTNQYKAGSSAKYRDLPIELRLTYLGLDESKLPLNTQTLTYELRSNDTLIKSGILEGSDAQREENNGGPCYKWDLGSIKFPVGGTTTLKVTPAGGAVDGYLFGFADENGAAITNAKTDKGELALTLDISRTIDNLSIKGYRKDFFYAYTERTVTVRWVDEDGTELFKQENVKLSAIPEAGKYNELSNHENPTKADDDDFTYSFKSWSEGVKDTQGNVTYTASYDRTSKEPPKPETFTVIWEDGYNSTPIQSETYNVGTTSYRDDDPANPTRTNYSFTGWVEAVTQTDDNGNVTVITITAQWKEDTFTVTWLNGYDGGQVDAKTYGRATQATTYQGEYPANPTRPGSYRFTGWGDPVDDGNGNLTITAQWRYTGGSSEGGGGGGGSDPTPPRPTNPDPENPPVDIPDEQPPLTEDPTLDIPDVELPDEDVPLADIPDEQPPLAEEPEAEIPEVEIPEEEVPLAGVPQTGEASVTLWLAAALTAGAGLVYVNTGKRKEENQ